MGPIEGGGGLVSFKALAPEAGRQAAVVVPILMVELDELHAALGQPTCEQAVGGESAGVAGVGPVGIDHMRGLSAEVGDFGDARLQAERHFVVRDAR